MSKLEMATKFAFLSLLAWLAAASDDDLVRVMHMSRVFRDSNIFADLSLKTGVHVALRSFDAILSRSGGHPSKRDILEFIQANFNASRVMELEAWLPPDCRPEPAVLSRINDSQIRHLAQNLVESWSTLGKITKLDVALPPENYTLITLPNGFIAPGGSFREYCHWDSFWIIRGLLICDMHRTAKGMIENLFALVKDGFISNGGRVYYLDRSQPPLLALMADEYITASRDYKWLRENVDFLERELLFWLNFKMITVDYQGQSFSLARYRSVEDTPRLESYLEASTYKPEMENLGFFQNIRKGAESEWDFSGRWFFDARGRNTDDLLTINPTKILPVDLNSYLCKSFQIMSSFYTRLDNKDRSKFWFQQYLHLNDAIDSILYSEKDGIWYDYDLELKLQRKYYYPSNFAPLWCQLHKEMREFGKRANNYLQRVLKFRRHMQWDLSNSWVPTEAIIIFGLLKSKDPEAQRTAQDLAKRWMDTVFIVKDLTYETIEKYNVLFKGLYGGTKDLDIDGFAWSNGFTLAIIQDFYIAGDNDNGK